MKEKIICAAIQIISTQEIFYGHRHNHCITAKHDKLSWTMNRQEVHLLHTEQGFITSENRFVNRIEALKIAKENNQLIDETKSVGISLYSEDIY